MFHSSSVLELRSVCTFNLCNSTITPQALPNLSYLHNKMTTSASYLHKLQNCKYAIFDYKLRAQHFL